MNRRQRKKAWKRANDGDVIRREDTGLVAYGTARNAYWDVVPTYRDLSRNGRIEQDEVQARASASCARATLLSYRHGRIVNRRTFRLGGYVGA